MTHLIIHPGTGTIVNSDECWFIDANALPEGVDIEDLASTELFDIPEDIPATPNTGFSYSVSDLDKDIENDIFVSDHIEWLKALPAHEREFIIQNAFQIMLNQTDFWNEWWDSLRYSVSLSKRIIETSVEEEPF